MNPIIVSSPVDPELDGRVTAVEDAVAQAKAQVFDLVGYELIAASGTWTKSTFLTTHAPGIDADDIRLDIEVIGAGASGFKAITGTIAGYGGAPGGVTLIEKIHPDELAATLAAVIGAGGGLSPTAGSNAGGDTTFGPWQAMGGRGLNNLTSAVRVANLLPPSDIALACGATWYQNGMPMVPSPSNGPGAGGSGNYSAAGSNGGLGGGVSGARRAASMKAGGAIGTSVTESGDGLDADDAWSFGSGGAGGGGGTYKTGREGGFPGGGGGGGGCTGSVFGDGGPGGNGGVRIRCFVRRGVVAE